jgi:hypothetical protein
MLIVCAAALRTAPEVPKPRANESVHEGLKRDLFRSPEYCKQHAPELIAGIEGFLSEQQTSRIQGIFSNGERHNKLSFLLLGTKHSLCMTDNWIENALNTTTQPSLFVYVALDKESHSSCVTDFQPRGGKGQHTIECADMSDVLPWSDMKSPDMIGFGSCIYQLIVWMKPLFLKVATSSVVDPSSVLLIDTDVILHRDVHELLSEGRTSMFQVGHDDGRGNPNTGLMSINSNADELLRMWLERAPMYFGKDQADQYGLQRVLNSPEGQHFKEHMHLIPQSHLGMCAERGQYATHYNCVADKDVSMQLAGVFRPATQGCMDHQAELIKIIDDFHKWQAAHPEGKHLHKKANIFDHRTLEDFHSWQVAHPAEKHTRNSASVIDRELEDMIQKS